MVFSETKPKEVNTKPSLSVYLKNTKNPSLILRVPTAENNPNVSKETYVPAYNTIYNTIEKEFVKADFIVRDRQLYDKVLEQKTSGYSDINNITNTDLIIELIGITPSTIITNQYKDENGKTKSAYNETTITAVKAEFKIIKVRDNELAGSYTFYYTECEKGCVRLIKDARFYNPLIKSSGNVPVYYDTNNESLEEFYQRVARNLITELKDKKIF